MAPSTSESPLKASVTVSMTEDGNTTYRLDLGPGRTLNNVGDTFTSLVEDLATFTTRWRNDNNRHASRNSQSRNHHLPSTSGTTITAAPNRARHGAGSEVGQTEPPTETHETVTPNTGIPATEAQTAKTRSPTTEATTAKTQSPTTEAMTTTACPRANEAKRPSTTGKRAHFKDQSSAAVESNTTRVPPETSGRMTVNNRLLDNILASRIPSVFSFVSGLVRSIASEYPQTSQAIVQGLEDYLTDPSDDDVPDKGTVLPKSTKNKHQKTRSRHHEGSTTAKTNDPIPSDPTATQAFTTAPTTPASSAERDSRRSARQPTVEDGAETTAPPPTDGDVTHRDPGREEAWNTLISTLQSLISIAGDLKSGA
ncbi:hypothetical protein TREMEDRAFT_64242 [Tremella mesenterica DSM 1558]|uniref:uncharacterized protein n=1 Tax=Tremella mesenterica (strain ATCC 24925 / CBS 8224 / DSM 1558 / NBRC 9311 / NRRL Y-6157 / RJB 2259-6 / UBC 559-6) TaxID=578456 RepID=UPI0003F4A3E3|nr:uncharacterized protein TREMEDRAFT_64242 [Tremella mesenterica DSM 1558]EIW67648.1 hypothetical protein TREMEDRAFT_64242 [Tremella mesenterica DSM 1558]